MGWNLSRLFPAGRRNPKFSLRGCTSQQKFFARGPGKNLAIVEPKYTFLSWEAKPQFFIKGPIKKRKGGFCLYSILLIGLFFCIFFCKFFVFFFVCTHWKGHCP